MISVVISAPLWGRKWQGSQLLFLSDNESVVSVLNSRSTKDSRLVHLSCCLFFFAACHNFTFTAEHIADKKNVATDALSRNNLTTFFNSTPQAQRTPCAVPSTLVSLLWDRPVEWTSPHWRQLFVDSMVRVSLRQQVEHIILPNRDSCHSV